MNRTLVAYELLCVCVINNLCVYKNCCCYICPLLLYAVLRVMCVVTAMLLQVPSHFMTELMLFCCFSTPHVCQKILEDP